MRSLSRINASLTRLQFYSPAALLHRPAVIMAKRKRSGVAAAESNGNFDPTPIMSTSTIPLPGKELPTRRSGRPSRANTALTNPNENHAIKDSHNALRASPNRDADECGHRTLTEATSEPAQVNGDTNSPAPKKRKPAKDEVATPKKAGMKSGKEESGVLDPEAAEDEEVDEEELKEALGRPPPVNSSYLPLPWKGRLGYVSDARTSQGILS
jgi:UV DNA damage endonuclease